MPDLRLMDKLIDIKLYRQGTHLTPGVEQSLEVAHEIITPATGTQFLVNIIEFAFTTDTDENQMSLMTTSWPLATSQGG